MSPYFGSRNATTRVPLRSHDTQLIHLPRTNLASPSDESLSSQSVADDEVTIVGDDLTIGDDVTLRHSRISSNSRPTQRYTFSSGTTVPPPVPTPPLRTLLDRVQPSPQAAYLAANPRFRPYENPRPAPEPPRGRRSSLGAGTIRALRTTRRSIDWVLARHASNPFRSSPSTPSTPAEEIVPIEPAMPREPSPVSIAAPITQIQPDHAPRLDSRWSFQRRTQSQPATSMPRPRGRTSSLNSFRTFVHRPNNHLSQIDSLLYRALPSSSTESLSSLSASSSSSTTPVAPGAAVSTSTSNNRPLRLALPPISPLEIPEISFAQSPTLPPPIPTASSSCSSPTSADYPISPTSRRKSLTRERAHANLKGDAAAGRKRVRSVGGEKSPLEEDGVMAG